LDKECIEGFSSFYRNTNLSLKKIYAGHQPAYSGGRDQEDPGSKPAQGNHSGDPISKKPITKQVLEEWLK
jgi:hypothetical protein